MLWVRSAIFTLLGPGLVLIGVPVSLLSTTSGRLGLGAARWLGLPLIVVGTVALLWCIWDFGHAGRGTLNPIDAPRFVVRGGLYRYVRNPMYVSVLTVLLGEVLLFRSAWLLVWAAVMATAFSLFVITYEEPHLSHQFGEFYEAYRYAVPRWLPRPPRH